MPAPYKINHSSQYMTLAALERLLSWKKWVNLTEKCRLGSWIVSSVDVTPNLSFTGPQTEPVNEQGLFVGKVHR